MAELYGWAGKVLHVDLTDRKITKVPTAQYEPEKFIGGVGLNTKIFWDMGCPKVGAFDPGNPLMISVGPLTGLPGPYNRAEICGIGAQNYPLEQFTYSGFGGKFPSELKYAGYDAIVIVGKADRPVYLSIRDEDIEIKDGAELWGLDLFESQKALEESEKLSATLAIGPAGENLSRTAIVATETGSTAGQGGFGAVMGSKNLKAISVRGTGVVKIARPGDFIELIESLQKRDSWLEGSAQQWARAPLCGGDVSHEMSKKYRKKFAGPYGCPYQCMGFYDVPGVGKGAAMCASWWFGWFRQDADATKVVWEANLLSQKLGINHFELLELLAIAMETIMQGVMTWEDWERFGLPPVPEEWGGTATDREFITKLLNGIADGTSLFSQGMARALNHIIGEIEDSTALKQMVEVMYPAWGYPQHYYGWIGLCLHVALDTRDSGNSTDGYLAFNRDNARGIPFSELGEHFGVPYGSSSFAHPPGSEVEAAWEGIEHQSRWVMNNQCLKNSLPLCNFASLPDSYFHPPDMDIRVFESRSFSLVTGIDHDVEELWKAGERIWNLRRAVMMAREDRSREIDTYADNFFDSPWLDIQHGDFILTAYIDKKKFEALKDRYYELAGWDVKTGWPTRAKLEELDLKDVADALEKMDKLPHP